MTCESRLLNKSLTYNGLNVWSCVGRDLFLIMSGIFVLIHTPKSIESFGITGILVLIWVSMLGGGATLSLIGVLTKTTVFEVFGSSLVAGSFLLWAISLFASSGGSFISVSLGFVFLSSSFLQFYRINTLPVVRIS